MTELFEATLQDHLDSREWFQLVIRYHGDPSALGSEIAEHERHAREELAKICGRSLSSSECAPLVKKRLPCSPSS